MNTFIKDITKKSESSIIGKKCGTVTVSVYKDEFSGSHIFYIKTDTDDVLPVSYVIEDVLSLY